MGVNQRYRLSRQGATAAGLAAVLVVSLAAASVLGLRWNGDLREQLASRMATVSALTRRGSAGDSSPAANAHHWLISGSTRGIAVAELQRIISDVAGTNDMLIDSMQALTPDIRDGITAVRIEAMMRGSLTGLVGSIHAIETRLPLLFVSEADITAGIDGPVENPSSHLTVRLVVEGYLEDQS